MADGWRNRPRGNEPARHDQRAHGARTQVPAVHSRGVIIRCHGEKRRRSAGEPGVSGPVPGSHGLRLHLVMIPPGTRCQPHFHDTESAIYVVSGEADAWHGADLAKRSVVRAGDFIYIPPGTPHLAVNRGEVTAIAVVAGADPADQGEFVVIELPRHLTGLLSYPLAAGL